MLTFLETISSVWAALAFMYNREIVNKSLVSLYKNWSLIDINDHAILGLVNDPNGRKPIFNYVGLQ